MNIEITQGRVSLLFCILFVVTGWIAPAAYASYAPEDTYIETHAFYAEDTSVSEESHLICFDRTVGKSQSGKVFTELFLVNDNRTVKIDAHTMERYFQDGHRAVVTPFPLPDNIAAGNYKYVLVVRMNLAQGRIQREFEFESDIFTISNDTAEPSPVSSFKCRT